jgi:uronate dehydrogenase
MPLYEKLLVTGAAGKLARHLRPALQPLARSVRLMDIASIDEAGGWEEVRLADLADLDAMHAVMEGVEAVIHFGGLIREAPFPDILRSNILGTHNVWEAAHTAGAKRVVYASSCHAVGMYRRDERLDGNSLQRPNGYYGLSKAFGEDVARMYYDRHGIEAACLRIGSCFEEATGERVLATWLSRDDLNRLVTACLRAPYLGCTIVYGMSANGQTFWDNSAVDYIGYRPQDSAEVFREKVGGLATPKDRDDPEVIYQAGSFAKGMTR